jgi:hypothetical protein
VCVEHRKTLAIFVFLLWVAPVFAQSDVVGRFVQRLSWDADPNVFKYVVVIAREGGEVVERRTTAGDYVEVSLPPGRYWFTVDVYDLLDLFDYQMDAVSFEVIEALQPVVTAWSPKVLSISEGNGEVVLSGENFAAGAQVFLRKDGARGAEVMAEVQVLGGETARLFLPLREVESGTWTIYFTNPSGLSAVVHGFRVKHYEKAGIDLSLLYSPLMPVNLGELNLPGLNFFVGGNFLFDSVLVNDFYHGISLRLAWFPIRFARSSLGFMLEPYLASLATDIPSNLALNVSDSYLGGAGFSVILQTFLLRNRLALHFSAGGGMLGLFNFILVSDAGVESNYDMMLWSFLDLGLSFKFFLLKSFFVEFGASWNASAPFENPEFQFLKFLGGIGYSF